MLACPRSAITPPPGLPMLPSSSWMIAPARMYCAPTECCVQPTLYTSAAVRSRPEFSAHALRDLKELLGRHPAHPLHHLRRVAGVVPLEDLIHASRMLQRRVGRDVTGSALDRRATGAVLVRRGALLARPRRH